MGLKEDIKSVLSTGSSSEKLNELFFTCQNMAFAYMCVQKNLKKSLDISRKMGCGLEDLACDSIAELFENRNNHYVHFSNYFQPVKDKLDKMTDDEVTAFLSVLIRSKVKQYFSFIGGDSGDIFIKVRKAIKMHLERNKNYYRIVTKCKKTYVFSVNTLEINLDLPVMPVDDIVTRLFDIKITHNFISEIVEGIYVILNEQEEYSKGILKNDLFIVVKKYFEKRLVER